MWVEQVVNLGQEGILLLSLSIGALGATRGTRRLGALQGTGFTRAVERGAAAREGEHA